MALGSYRPVKTVRLVRIVLFAVWGARLGCRAARRQIEGAGAFGAHARRCLSAATAARPQSHRGTARDAPCRPALLPDRATSSWKNKRCENGIRFTVIDRKRTGFRVSSQRFPSRPIQRPWPVQCPRLKPSDVLFPDTDLRSRGGVGGASVRGESSLRHVFSWPPL